MIQLVGIGGVAIGTLDALAARVARELRESCRVRTEGLEPSFAFDPVRGQYHSTAILRHLAGMAGRDRLLGVAAVDLYVPIFTFVFGEAQLGGPAALISTYRLRPQYYGEAESGRVLDDRLLKEALHELGHTYGLRHCQDWSCPMATSTAIERLDLKGTGYCRACWGIILRS